MATSITGLKSETTEFAADSRGRMPVKMAIVLIGALSAGLWLGLYGLVSALLP